MCCCIGITDKFATEHPDLAKKMLLAHTRAIEYIYEHPAKAAEIFAKNYNQPLEVAYSTIWRKTVMEGRSLSWKTVKENYDWTFNYAKQLGLADFQEFGPFESYADLTLLNACGADDFDTFIATRVDPVFPSGMAYDAWKAKAIEIG